MANEPDNRPVVLADPQSPARIDISFEDNAATATYYDGKTQEPQTFALKGSGNIRQAIVDYWEKKDTEQRGTFFRNSHDKDGHFDPTLLNSQMSVASVTPTAKSAEKPTAGPPPAQQSSTHWMRDWASTAWTSIGGGSESVAQTAPGETPPAQTPEDIAHKKPSPTTFQGSSPHPHAKSPANPAHPERTSRSDQDPSDTHPQANTPGDIALNHTAAEGWDIPGGHGNAGGHIDMTADPRKAAVLNGKIGKDSVSGNEDAVHKSLRAHGYSENQANRALATADGHIGDADVLNGQQLKELDEAKAAAQAAPAQKEENKTAPNAAAPAQPTQPAQQPGAQPAGQPPQWVVTPVAVMPVASGVGLGGYPGHHRNFAGLAVTAGITAGVGLTGAFVAAGHKVWPGGRGGGGPGMGGHHR